MFPMHTIRKRPLSSLSDRAGKDNEQEEGEREEHYNARARKWYKDLLSSLILLSFAHIRTNPARRGRETCVIIVCAGGKALEEQKFE